MQPLMIQGVGSHTGKTTLVAGLCRLFANRGLRVAPFKSQNMSLESVVTKTGGEIARATALQATAARQEPTVDMNPILLKPKTDSVSQLIIHGRPVRDVTAQEYFASDSLDALKWEAIETSIARLQADYDLIVAEGAGSCAEPNLRARDVVNMGLAHRLNAGVFIVTDIDKGGVFAEMLGTLRVLELVHSSDLELVRGFIINKFRGDRSVLEPALTFAREHLTKPITGLLPMLHLALEQEDRVREAFCATPEIDVAAIYLPHLSNASDLDPLANETNVRVRWVRSSNELGAPDAIILPGSKSTTWDLDYLRRTGLVQAILAKRETTTIVGLCGGYQMLGRRLNDEACLESALGSMDGLGLLDIDFAFRPGKVLRNETWHPTTRNPWAQAGDVSGYEIHCGELHRRSAPALFRLATGEEEGAVSADGLVFGTFLHDVFWNPPFTRTFVNGLRAIKGLPALDGPLRDLRRERDRSLDQLAAAIEEHLPALSQWAA